ncbi:MAG: hypothetical protein QM736_23365 [Vicinamibacterales bacterium]
MRLLHARLFGEVLTPAPQTVQVSLWRPLPLPPAERLDGHQSDAVPDVTIETEHAVWTVLCVSERDWEGIDERVSRIIAAGAWHAGARRYYCGAIDAGVRFPSVSESLKGRFSRSRESASLRTGSRSAAVGCEVTLGAASWSCLAAVLDECTNARSLPRIERLLAGNAASWLEHVGVRSAD